MKKFFLFLILAAAVFVFLMSYPVIKNRYFSDIPSNPKSQIKKQLPEPNISGEEAKEPEPKNEDEPVNITVTPADCDNECANYQEKENESRYCEEVCGISDIYDYGDEDENSADGEDSPDPNDCSQNSGLKKDYCYKNSAIKKKDFQACSKISDEAIKKTCQNRITEDILEQ